MLETDLKVTRQHIERQIEATKQALASLQGELAALDRNCHHIWG